MKKFLLPVLVLFAAALFAQNDALKIDVPAIALGEKQNFQAISFEALGPDKFSILYAQELPASIVGEREFRSDKFDGAYLDQQFRQFIPHSSQALLLVRQTLNAAGEATTNFWVVALRGLESDVKYTMYFTKDFVHPIIKDAIPVTNSLQNLDQVNGLSAREFAALTEMAKRTYNFYEYRTPPAIAHEPTLLENIQLLKSGFKELKSVLGKGDIPKEEKFLFKREILDGMTLAATKLDKKDSVEIKLYLAGNGGSNYELLKAETFFGSTNPGFATTLVYDGDLKVAGAFGHVLLKYKDATGAKAYFLALGIDDKGDARFWKVDAGKNGLNSFMPWFSFVDANGIYVISYNNEKIFKPVFQYHLLKRDGSATLLYPIGEGEYGSEKNEYVYTGQDKPAPNSGNGNYATVIPEKVPVGLFYWNKNKYVFMGTKTVQNNGSVSTTSYSDIAVMRINSDEKIKEVYNLADNKSAEPVYARLLGNYTNKAYFMVNYPYHFKLIMNGDKIETDQTESPTARLVNTSTGDYLSHNQYGNVFLTKTVAGNKYTLEFFPGK